MGELIPTDSRTLTFAGSWSFNPLRMGELIPTQGVQWLARASDRFNPLRMGELIPTSLWKILTNFAGHVQTFQSPSHGGTNSYKRKKLVDDYILRGFNPLRMGELIPTQWHALEVA